MSQKHSGVTVKKHIDPLFACNVKELLSLVQNDGGVEFFVQRI